MRERTLPAVVAGLSIMMAAMPAVAQPAAIGTWVRPSTGGEIRSFPCGGGIGLKVTKSADRAKVGRQLMCGAREAAPGRYEGSILNLDDGRTYSGVVELLNGGASLRLSGCVLGIVCRSETWRRK